MPCRALLRFCALVLTLTLFTARVGSVAYENFTAPIQQSLAPVPSLCSDDCRAKVKLFKPSKRMAECLTLADPGVLSPPGRLLFPAPAAPINLLLPQGVCRAIYIPPEVTV